MRKTKIVCTMGPREEDKDILLALAEEMDVARFNFSHGSQESHLEMLGRVREAAEKAGRPIAALLDTKGPEIRTWLLENNETVILEQDSLVRISPLPDDENERDSTFGNSSHIFVTYAKMAEDLKEGDMVLLDDGVMELAVTDIEGRDVICRVIHGGELSERKGVNLPGVKVGLPDLTDKDADDIRFGLEHGFDYIAASFVRNAATIHKIRGMIEEAGSCTRIIAKIESGEGLENLDEIIDAADGIMVARGDLGVEVEARKVPQLQREMIEKCNMRGKIVITATQMLDSMINNPRPTRAEVTDVANAVYEGSDAVMLSGETAAGAYPVEAVKMMASIAEYTEQFTKNNDFADLRRLDFNLDSSVSSTTCKAAVGAALDLNAKAIIAPTSSGSTVLHVSKCRPVADIFAFSPDPAVVRQMMLFWGVRPELAERAHSTDELMDDCLEMIRDKGLVDDGDVCVFVAGVVSGRKAYQRSETNTMRIIQI